MTISTFAGPAIFDAARANLDETVRIRRSLHRHPEVGLQLPLTQAAVVAELGRLGLPAVPGRAVTSVVSWIDGARPGRTILLRADMDGLPLHEDTGLEFASEIPGAMHACGHDTHVAMLLGAVGLLRGRREDWAGRVLLMFQPGEEGYHGARHMLDEGLLTAAPGGEAPTAAFALHISTAYPRGTINHRSGSIYAAADFLRIRIRGRGGHASAPHQALDPITVSAEIILGLQTMVGRSIDVFDPAVVTIAHVEAGTTNNIIPETAFLDGTIRTLSPATRELVHERISRLVDGIAAAHGATAELEIETGYPVTVNDDAFTSFAVDTARQVLGDEAVVPLPAPIMGAEDFSYVLERVPGAMVFLGARLDGADPATVAMNHSNRVVFDEDSLASGAAVYAAVALRWLAENG